MDRTNGRTSRGQYSMRFKLVNKRTEEVVDTIDVLKTSKEIATEHFKLKKRLPLETFNKLYEVVGTKKDDGDRPTRF
jgi:hypothetical protein